MWRFALSEANRVFLTKTKSYLRFCGMITNTQQMLRDPDVEPSSEVITKALEESNNAYKKMQANLQATIFI